MCNATKKEQGLGGRIVAPILTSLPSLPRPPGPGAKAAADAHHPLPFPNTTLGEQCKSYRSLLHCKRSGLGWAARLRWGQPPLYRRC